MATPRELGERIEAARLARRWTVKHAAAQAQITRDTWRKVERAEGGVQDAKRAAVLDVLGLDAEGRSPSDGKSPSDVSIDDLISTARRVKELERRITQLEERLEELEPADPRTEGERRADFDVFFDQSVQQEQDHLTPGNVGNLSAVSADENARAEVKEAARTVGGRDRQRQEQGHGDDEGPQEPGPVHGA